MKKLGVLGGLGPMASVYFLQLIVEMTQAGTDQEHIEILLHSVPQVPDRTRYILGLSGNDPVPQMVEAGKGLVVQGAQLLAIPCITAHYFQERLENRIGVPILNAVEETALYLRQAGIAHVGVMATDGTLSSRLFQTCFEKHGIECVTPDKQDQRAVMHLIYDNVKAGKPVEYPLFEAVSEQLFARGAQVNLLGCTELSLIGRDHGLGPGFLDVLEVLARKAVLCCGRLKEEYKNLIAEAK